MASKGNGFTSDARTALEIAPNYFLGWYTVKSLALVAVFGALCYQLGRQAGPALGPRAPALPPR